MKTTRTIARIDNMGRKLLAIVMLLSGISKLFYLQGFSEEVAKYSELYVSQSLVSWSKVIAVGVCCTETLLGILLPMSKISLYTTLAAFVLMTFFLYLTGMNYLFPTALGSVESCGCFGELVHFSAKGSLVKNVALWTATLITAICNRKNKTDRPAITKGE
jgi:hypothetical protein